MTTMTIRHSAPFTLVPGEPSYADQTVTEYAVLNTRNHFEVEALIMRGSSGTWMIRTAHPRGGFNMPTASERGFADADKAFDQWCADYAIDCQTP